MGTSSEEAIEILDQILVLTQKLSKHIKQPDQFVKVTDIELAVYEARKTFEYTDTPNGTG